MLHVPAATPASLPRGLRRGCSGRDQRGGHQQNLDGRTRSTSSIADGTVAINDARTVDQPSQYLLGSLPEVPTRSPIATTVVAQEALQHFVGGTVSLGLKVDCDAYRLLPIIEFRPDEISVS